MALGPSWCKFAKPQWRLPKLEVDGDWGRHTQEAVEAFRASIGLDPHGPVDGDVWQVLVAGEGLQVVDSVDVSAIPYKGRDGKDHVLNSDYGEVYANDIEAGGGHPLRLNRKVGKGVEDAIQRIITDVGDNMIALLRFQGHGNHGTWFTVKAGDPVDLKAADPKAFKELAADWHGYIDIHNFDKHKLTLAKLTPYFAPFGCVRAPAAGSVPTTKIIAAAKTRQPLESTCVRGQARPVLHKANSVVFFFSKALY